MKKFLLVTFIGVVLAINVYGIVTDILAEINAKEIDPLEGVATVVYME